MAIKSDRWIRRMAADGMIEPFAENQVRSVDGRKIVSYGTSSYGYDVRCAGEFKIFTNINSTIVDPKNFDEKSFVDMNSDVCIIPPNSFALARTVEYFRVPRNVLIVCLGKCVTGDTRVVDADTGAYVPITQMRFGTQTLGLKDWQLKSARSSECFSQGVQPVFELRTRAGLRMRATATHPLRQLHGWTPLSDLKSGDRIAVARNVPVFGRTPLPDWEATLLGLMLAEGQCSTPGHSPTFTTSDPALADLLRNAVLAGALGEVSYNGALGYRIVNHKGRGGKPEGNRATQWLKRHQINVKAAGKFVPQCVFTAPARSVRLFLQALFAGDGGIYQSQGGFYLEYYSKSRRLIEDVHHLLLRFGVFSLMREKRTEIGTEAHSIQITDREQIAAFAYRIGLAPGCIKDKRLQEEIVPALGLAARRIKSNFDTLPREAWPLLTLAVGRAGISLNRLDVHPKRRQSLSYVAAARVALATEDESLQSLVHGPVWDVVEAIEPAGREEVFDISVPEMHCFLANDLIVHNSTYARCGIIVNVTPLEPEWEGHVTLEFSNTTPLPAKIYANEGVAQMLFFESDETCETSYKDRGGKYQGQKGVTLPRT